MKKKEIKDKLNVVTVERDALYNKYLDTRNSLTSLNRLNDQLLNDFEIVQDVIDKSAEHIDSLENRIKELEIQNANVQADADKYEMLWKRECNAFRILATRYNDWLDCSRAKKEVLSDE
jgi:uncharacterized coiled-coil DUF342 family protein